VIAILISGAVAGALALMGTPLVTTYFRTRGFGQPIREEGPQTHYSKAGTPTMGGTAIVIAAVVAYLVAHVGNTPFTAAGVLVLATFVGMAAVGFADDFIKVRHQRNLGLNKTTKFLGQALIAALFAYLGPTLAGLPRNVSIVGDLAVDLPGWAFFFWVFLLLAGASNAVNLTDGLDGLAIVPVMIAASCFAFIAYLVGNTVYSSYLQIHYVPGTGELAVFCGALVGAGLGFLWYNAPPAMVFMGDTGSLSLGGAIGTIAVAVKHEIVLAIIGGLFVMEALSVMVQITSYKLTGKRVFKMAPIHHHFEHLGWTEVPAVLEDIPFFDGS
jgi:phospho-N-acetylmuramoyl-pentapeptide-transferase